MAMIVAMVNDDEALVDDSGSLATRNDRCHMVLLPSSAMYRCDFVRVARDDVQLVEFCSEDVVTVASQPTEPY